MKTLIVLNLINLIEKIAWQRKCHGVHIHFNVRGETEVGFELNEASYGVVQDHDNL